MSAKYDDVWDIPLIEMIERIIDENKELPPRELAELIFDVMHPEAIAEESSDLILHQMGKPW